MKFADLTPREQAAVRAYYGAAASRDLPLPEEIPIGRLLLIRAVIASADATRDGACVACGGTGRECDGVGIEEHGGDLYDGEALCSRCDGSGKAAP